MYKSISTEHKDALATVTIQRAQALNALNREVFYELRQAIAAVEVQESVRVVVITGSGVKAFAAGADVKAMADMSAAEGAEFARLGGAIMAMIEASSKPYIAAVHGYALGGGCELALACDFIYATDTAVFGQPEVKLGVIPGFGGTQRLARRVGSAKAKELIFTGKMLSSQQAHQIGLVDAVFSPEELMLEVEKTAAMIAENSAQAVAEAKRVIHHGASSSLSAAVTLEQQSFGLLFATEEQKTRMKRFVDKNYK